MSRDSSDIAVLRLQGPRLGLTECDEVKESLNQLLRGGQVRIILDLSEVDFMDSTMIGTLVAGIRRVNAFGGKVAVCNVQPGIERLLAILKLERIFLVSADVDQARREVME